MKLKTALYFLIFGTISYFGFDIVQAHTSGDVIVYKRYTKALMEGDRFRARRLVLSDEGLRPFDFLERRKNHYQGDIRITFHRILSQRYNADGNEVRLKVRQITRLNPEGEKGSLWGSQIREEIHHVVMRKNEGQNWKILSFYDPFIGG